MVESLHEVDSLALQRSLIVLEERYRELREIGQRRFEAWEKENAELKQQLDVLGRTLEGEKEAFNKLADRMHELETELAQKSADLAEAEAALAQVSCSLRQLV